MYSQMFQLYADFLKAVAHPRRLEIVHLLQDQELPVSDIHTMLDLPQANISQHLMLMRDAGVVKTRRDGKQMYYRLADKKIIQASELLRQVLIEQNHDSDVAKELGLEMKDLLTLAHDPVCHMRVSPKTANYSAEHNNKVFYFCASGCLKKFEEGPEKYV